MLFNLQPYQFIIAALSVAMIFFGLERYLRREPHQTLLKLIARISVWGGMAVIALFPKVTFRLAALLGIEGNINAAIIAGFLLVFLLIFKMLSVIERIERDISRLTTQQALHDFNKSLDRHTK